MESDMDDIHKIQSALNGKSQNHGFAINESSNQSDSGDGFSMAGNFQQGTTLLPDATFSIFEEFPTDLRDDEDQLVIDEMEPSLDNALTLNKAYQAVLIELLEKLEVLKVVSQTRQKTVVSEIKELETLIQQSNKKSGSTKKKKIQFAFFGIPYFKDQNFNISPKNEDALLAEQIGFRPIISPVQSKILTKIENRRLMNGLKAQALSIQATRLMKKREELQNQLKQLDSTKLTEAERKEIAKNLQIVQRQIFDVSEWPQEKLLSDIDAASVDWQKIAIVNFDRSRSPEQLQLHFVHYLNPNVNTASWTMEENRRLKELVKEYENGVEWEELAEKLNTKRTPYECFRRFQERFNPQHRKFGWTLKDNKKLISVISQYGDKTTHEVEWDEVRLQFPGRSRQQLYAYYIQGGVADFTPAEDTLITEGYNAGFSAGDIALLLGRRTSMQIRLRHKVLKGRPQPPTRPWTKCEDAILLKLRSVNTLTRSVQRGFMGRRLCQLFSRYHFLQMKKTTPAEYVKRLKANRMKMGANSVPRKAITSSVARPAPLYCETLPLKTSILPRLKAQLMYSTVKAALTKELLPGRMYEPNLTKQRIIARKLKELKEIIRPFMALYTKRNRVITYAGDGRECGIIMACFYRILRANFTLAPKNDFTAEQMEELGVEDHNFPGYESLMLLIKDMEAPSSQSSRENILCLPPSLSTLVGFRGLLLHRKYLITSAKKEYRLPEPSVVELTDSEAQLDPSGSRDGTVSPMEVVDVNAAAPANEEVESQRRETPTSQESNSLAISQATKSSQDNGISVDAQHLDKRHSNATDKHTPVSESAHLIEYMEEPDESMFEEAQHFFDGQSQTSEETEEEQEQEEEEFAEEDDDFEFGNREADALLLSRLLSLFYWPGIMSTVEITEEMRRAAEQTTPDPEPEPMHANEKERKQYMKERRRENMKAIVRRRFGLPDPPPPPPPSNQEPAPGYSRAEAQPEPEPPKKKKKRERKATVPAAPAEPPANGRVTRSRSKSAANS